MKVYFVCESCTFKKSEATLRYKGDEYGLFAVL